MDVSPVTLDIPVVQGVLIRGEVISSSNITPEGDGGNTADYVGLTESNYIQ